MHPEFAPVAFLAASLLFLALPCHWRARNIAILAIIAWMFALNIIYGVDAVIWRNNVNTVVPVWCDITTKVIIGANIALPAACLCICIHLEFIASARVAQPILANKRHRQIFEALMSFFLPIVFMALHFIVQGHRFDIIEGYGCRPAIYVSIPAIIIIYVPSITMSLFSFGFAATALARFVRHRMIFARHLASSHNGLTTSHYFRLMLLSIFEMVRNAAVTSFSLWVSMFSYHPWTNWNDIPINFSHIDLYPPGSITHITLNCYYIAWWAVPASTLIFTAFLSFGKEAIQEYKDCFTWFRRNVLRQSIEVDPRDSNFATPSNSSEYPRVLEISHSSSLHGPFATSCSSLGMKELDSDYSSHFSSVSAPYAPV